LDALELLKSAVEEGVAFVPGEPFFANGGGENTLRLSYSIATPEEIASGMKVLGDVMKKAAVSA
jgi:2-aminoadipate transaminase